MGLGQTLREARLKHSLTASQVAAATRMKVQIVEDLEREEFSRIAAPIYGKGFIRLYADYVGLDPKPLIEEYVTRFVSPPSPSLMATDERRVRRPTPLPDPKKPARPPTAVDTPPEKKDAPETPTPPSTQEVGNDFFSHLRRAAATAATTTEATPSQPEPQAKTPESTVAPLPALAPLPTLAPPPVVKAAAPKGSDTPVRKPAPEPITPMEEAGESTWAQMRSSVGGTIKRGAQKTRTGLSMSGSAFHKRVVAPCGSGIRKGADAVAKKTRDAGQAVRDKTVNISGLKMKTLNGRWMIAALGILVVLVFMISALSRCNGGRSEREVSGDLPDTALRLAKEPPAPYLD